MSDPNGYNPMRWDCITKGCFNVKRRPKIEIFSDCFPGRIGMGDVDGLVEINGRFLLLEWKTESTNLPTGQRILYERLTQKDGFAVIVVVGDAETMEVSQLCWFVQGRQTPWLNATMETVKQRIKGWAGYSLEAKRATT